MVKAQPPRLRLLAGLDARLVRHHGVQRWLFHQHAQFPSPAAPTVTATAYQLFSSKAWNPTPSIATNDLRFGIGSTTSGHIEAQALFSASPVVLATVGDYIELTVTFTNTSGLFAQGGHLGFGLYNSGGDRPFGWRHEWHGHHQHHGRHRRGPGLAGLRLPHRLQRRDAPSCHSPGPKHHRRQQPGPHHRRQQQHELHGRGKPRERGVHTDALRGHPAYGNAPHHP